MTGEEISCFNMNDWNKCLEIIEDNWNRVYGTCEICKEKDGTITLELTTGGWSENEQIIDELCDTMFWFLFWQESKRGGYYKFVIVDKIKVEGR